MNQPNYHGYELGPDFDRARSQIATPFQYVDIDLTNAASNAVFNISGDFLYFDPATTGQVTLELNNQYNDPAAPFTVTAGFAINAVFKQVKLTWTAQAGKKARIMYSTGERVIPANTGVQNVAGTVSVSGNVNSLPAGFSYGAAFKSNTNLAVNTAELVFSAASNVNGAIVCAANHVEVQTAIGFGVFIAKSSAPTSIVDGDVITMPQAFSLSTSNTSCGKLDQPIRIPAGKGLYFISSATTSSSLRAALYTLL